MIHQPKVELQEIIKKIKRERERERLNTFLGENVKNFTLFCLDESLYSRPYSGYLFSNHSNICGDYEGLDSTPTIATAIRIISLIFYNCHSDKEEFCSCFKIVTHGPNYKLLQANPSLEISQVLRGRPCFFLDRRLLSIRTTIMDDLLVNG